VPKKTQKRKKIVTTEEIEGDEAETKIEEEEEEPKRKTELPYEVVEILNGDRQEVPPDLENWSMCIMRFSPKFTPDNKFELITGKIREVETLTSYKNVEDIIRREHRGGIYHVNVLNGLKQAATRAKIVIEGFPKVTMADMQHTAEKYPAVNEQGKKEEGAEYWRNKRAEYEAKAEAEKAKADYEKTTKKLQDDDEDEEDIDMNYRSPFAVPGFPQPGFEPIDRKALEAELEKKILDRFTREEELKENRRELKEMREELRRLREEGLKKPDDNGLNMKDVLKMMSDMTTKLVEAKTAPPAPQSEDKKIEAFATMLTGAMSSVNSMMMNTLQQTASAQQQILMETIKNAMSPPGDKDWKLELIEKGADTVKEFVGSIVDANKSKHEVQKKQLEVMGSGKIKPMMLPKGMIKTGKPAAPAPRPQPPRPATAPASAAAAPAAPAQASAAPQPDANAQEIFKRAEKLQQEAIAAYLTGTSPAFFARKTLDIAGQEVTMFLRESPTLESLRSLAFEQKGDEGVAEFDKYITNNAPARQWVETWLHEITLNFRPVAPDGTPIEEPQAPAPPTPPGAAQAAPQYQPPMPPGTEIDDADYEIEEEEFVDVDDYEAPLDYEAPMLTPPPVTFAEDAQVTFSPPDIEKNKKNIDGPESPESSMSGEPQTLVSSALKTGDGNEADGGGAAKNTPPK